MAEHDPMRLIVAVHSADELGGDPDHRTRLLSRPLVGWLLLQRYGEPITEHIDDCPILRAPALPFSGHPDFRGKWNP